MKKPGTLMLVVMIALCGSVFAQSAATDKNANALAGLDDQTLYKIGNYLKHVTPLTQDLKDEAAVCLKDSAAMGNGLAMVQLGEMYVSGWVKLEAGEDAVQLAIAWWNESWNHGATDGYYDLGLLYANAPIPGTSLDAGQNLVKQDNGKAFQYFQASFERGAVKAGRYVGIYYEQGLVVKQDYAMAAKYFDLASQRGDSTSKFYLANYLLEGKGIAQDVKKAMSIYQDTVDKKGHDIGNCANALGQIYEKGKYLPADQKKAIDYYLIAAANGNSEAKKSLADYAAGLYKQGYEQLKSGKYESAFPLLLQAANLGNPDALKLTSSGK